MLICESLFVKFRVGRIISFLRGIFGFLPLGRKNSDWILTESDSYFILQIGLNHKKELTDYDRELSD
jgi:hypothetical protein